MNKEEKVESVIQRVRTACAGNSNPFFESELIKDIRELLDGPPACYQPALSPMGWCMNRENKDICKTDLTKCRYVLSKDNEKLKIEHTKKGAQYPYKIVQIKK